MGLSEGGGTCSGFRGSLPKARLMQLPRRRVLRMWQLAPSLAIHSCSQGAALHRLGFHQNRENIKRPRIRRIGKYVTSGNKKATFRDTEWAQSDEGAEFQCNNSLGA